MGRVFVSHSRKNRDMAVQLCQVLNRAGVSTFLDQDKILPGDGLTITLRRAVEACEFLLLLWSSHAANSPWVDLEWNAAYDLRKRIIPYKLDATPLPEILRDRLFIEADDRYRSNAQLLRAVGIEDAPPGLPFPGQWRAEVTAGGNMVGGSYQLTLRHNGQIHGVGKVNMGGPMAMMVAQLGVGHILDMSLPVQGSWRYEPEARLLTITLLVTFQGQVNQDEVRIRTTGREHTLSGTDYAGRSWTLVRLEPPKAAPAVY